MKKFLLMFLLIPCVAAEWQDLTFSVSHPVTSYTEWIERQKLDMKNFERGIFFSSSMKEFFYLKSKEEEDVLSSIEVMQRSYAIMYVVYMRNLLERHPVVPAPCPLRTAAGVVLAVTFGNSFLPIENYKDRWFTSVLVAGGASFLESWRKKQVVEQYNKACKLYTFFIRQDKTNEHHVTYIINPYTLDLVKNEKIEQENRRMRGIFSQSKVALPSTMFSRKADGFWRYDTFMEQFKLEKL
jgi:hypothetical protein